MHPHQRAVDAKLAATPANLLLARTGGKRTLNPDSHVSSHRSLLLAFIRQRKPKGVGQGSQYITWYTKRISGEWVHIEIPRLAIQIAHPFLALGKHGPFLWPAEKNTSLTNQGGDEKRESYTACGYEARRLGCGSRSSVDAGAQAA